MPRHAVFGLEPPHGSNKQLRSISVSSARILVYGDSLTAGYPDFLPYARALAVACATAGLNLEGVGCGLCGLTAHELLKHLSSRGVNDLQGRTGIGLQKLLEDQAADEGPFDLILIMVGTNDVIDASHRPEDTVQNIKNLHAACHRRGACTVALSIPDIGCKLSSLQRSMWQQVNSELHAWAEDATNVKTYFVNSSQLLPYSDEMVARGAWETDGIHFSEVGSVIFGTALAQQVCWILAPDGRSLGTDEFDLQSVMVACGVGETLHDAEKESEDAPCGRTSLQPKQKRLLVLGSSVAQGVGALPCKSWVDRLAMAVRSHGFEVDNDAIEASSISVLQERLCNLDADFFDGYSLVVASISLSDEGLSQCQTPEELAAVEQHFVDGVQMVLFLLRGKTHFGTRLVIGNVHPDHSYTEAHAQVLVRASRTVLSLQEVDHVIDFLHPLVHDGNGHWIDGITGDSGYPNDLGHERMFMCVDVPALLGNC
eukprot:gnl/TRDRNA2_/TRDRNA2_192576_c0_seq1.p1 gnl/TRDRNA2_/TRDRNA2_192576_c0~~gnl/TRDRNA2_/TRDRNA2_192576_c0_seq1.p1  ORF type:complete len:484 (-),score=53.41 gnl/TRDRNA2_/TRDRNA2_192576_c0_seq1:292-1743(-)